MEVAMSKYSYDPGPTISHAGGINLGTPDLEKSLWFFEDLLGMEVTARREGKAYLRGYQERIHHSLVLTKQQEAIVNTMSFRVSRPEDVELFYERLVKGDNEVLEIPEGAEVGRGEAIRFLIPGAEHPVELFYHIEKPEAPAGLRSLVHGNVSRRRGLGIQRLDHHNVTTSTETLPAAERWLCEELGMKRREFAVGPADDLQISWLSVNSTLHDIAIGANDAFGRAHF